MLAVRDFLKKFKSGNTLDDLLYVLFFEVLKKAIMEFPFNIWFVWPANFNDSPLTNRNYI